MDTHAYIHTDTISVTAVIDTYRKFEKYRRVKKMRNYYSALQVNTISAFISFFHTLMIDIVVMMLYITFDSRFFS